MVIGKLGVLLAVAIGTLLFSGSVAVASDTDVGRAHLLAINGSTVDAHIIFRDDQDRHVLTIDGRATGLAPGGLFFSLLYDDGSVPTGPDACEPNIEENPPGSDGFLTLAQMWGGFWTQVGTTNKWRLHVVKTDSGAIPPAPVIPGGPDLSGPSYVSLDKIGTMSVRRAADFGLRACGRVRS